MRGRDARVGPHWLTSGENCSRNGSEADALVEAAVTVESRRGIREPGPLEGRGTGETRLDAIFLKRQTKSLPREIKEVKTLWTIRST